MRDVDRDSRNRLVYSLGYVLACCLFVCGLDVDHIPKYIFALTTNGRLWHDPYLFTIASVCFALVITALAYRLRRHNLR